MKKLKHISLFIFALGAFALSSCTKTTTEPDPTPTDPFEKLIYIGETEVVGAGAIVKLYAEDELFVGYNRLHVALFDSANHNTPLTDAHVTFQPMMDMGMMKHTCPVENPTITVEDGTNAFTGAAVFIMPTTATGAWTFNIMVHNHANNQEGIAALPITVVEKAEPRLITFISDFDSAKLFVTRIDPVNPAIGLNDIVFGIYKKESMMSFPAVDNYTIIMEPEMPSMNHGSPNNVNPVSMGGGKYQGVVNFTMTGYWKINLDFKTANGDNIKLNQYFDVTFQ
tara:strand:+ start:27009 stop:27854 length:846 start_codon:yes stop_codon:yes gene_type:complete